MSTLLGSVTADVEALSDRTLDKYTDTDAVWLPHADLDEHRGGYNRPPD